MRDLIVDALAVYKLTRLATGTDRITSDLNEKVKQTLTERGHHEAAYFVTCPHCTSVWLAIVAVVGRRCFPKVWGPVAEVLAFSAAAGITAEML